MVKSSGADKTKKTVAKKPKKPAADETKEHIQIRKGLQLYDLEDRLEFVVYTREKRRLEDAEGVSRLHDGVYYHALGADHVDGSNYKEECHWSSLDEVVEWALASRRGDGVTGNFDPFAKDRAAKFTRHPLVLENLDDPDGFWSREGECNKKALQLARTAQRRLAANLADDNKMGSTLTLMLQSFSIFENLANLVHRGLQFKPRASRGKDDDERDYVATTAPIFVTPEVLYVFERILKIGGWVEVDGKWRPINGDAVVRVLGPNAIKSGHNAMRKIKAFKPNLLRAYYRAHPDAAVAKLRYFFSLAQVSTVEDRKVSAAADEELGAAARGSDGRLYPAWVLRNKMDDLRTAAHPIDPRVECFSYVELGDALDFSISIRPKSVAPYKGLSLPIGSDITARFAWNTLRRGDAPSGPTPMT